MSAQHLDVGQHLDGLAAATDRLVGWAGEAGPDASVPSCPAWLVRDLVVHQGAVHRWATAMLRGGDPRTLDIPDLEPEGRAAPDLLGWLRAGADDLLATLADAPDDLEAFTFLREAPPARLFWARRQHHETAVHALDVLAAREGRMPCAADAWWGADVAVDAVDELLVGFWPRRGRGPRAHGDPYAALVTASDSGDRWHVVVSGDATTARRLAPSDPEPAGAARLVGPATELHLALWHRGGVVTDPDGLLPRWAVGGAVV
ncbi:maleylpyruvate isomerase N-terminal domain-containing protein [Arthrobacter sp. NEB 688]|uniref:maleylpyruvate isomerase N-terminal domain-containing protein n=1 Tax=Arthrobacter sp. NEB 688 TaxID=904039 RepID=UPI001566EA63|nr:maleylpyruvate isomerase N-terminal domain-containing protein [Arthrobacter sp. NEB 688]QKE83641.1 maleylpyruvate isomerase family mycothiol-dependent enzyme [Arthrobacter sp. NEB 688]